MKAEVSIKKNIFMNALLTMSAFIFQIVTFPYATRTLGPVGIGKSSFAISLISYFVLFSQLGIPTYGVVACSKVRDNKEELTKVTKELLFIGIINTAFVYVVFLASLFLLPRLSSDKTLFLVSSVTILLNVFGCEWLYKALEQYSYIAKRTIIFKVVAIVFMLLAVHSEGDYIVYTAITVFATSGSLILNFVYSRRYIDWKSHTSIDINRHVKFIMTFFAMSCATTIYTHLDSVMLGFMKTDEIVGYYNAAVKMKTFLLSVVTSLGAVLLPRASYYIRNNEIDKFKQISYKALNFVLFLGTSCSVFFFIFAEETIVILSGKEFLGSVVAMKIIMPTVLFIGLSNITGIQMLIPMGKEKVVLKSEVVGALDNVLFNSLLIPQYGTEGAAIGTLVAESVVLLVQMFSLKKELKEAFSNFKWLSYFVSLFMGVCISSFLRGLICDVFFRISVGACVFGICLLVWLFTSKFLTERIGIHIKR